MHYPRNGEVVVDRPVVVRLFRLCMTEDKNEIAICEKNDTLSGSPTEAVIPLTLRDFLLDKWIVALTEIGAVGEKSAQKTKTVKREFRFVTASDDGSMCRAKDKKP
ncbi:hypothetical protein ACHAO8_011358 [Botrytis cinerea]